MHTTPSPAFPPLLVMGRGRVKGGGKGERSRTGINPLDLQQAQDMTPTRKMDGAPWRRGYRICWRLWPWACDAGDAARVKECRDVCWCSFAGVAVWGAMNRMRQVGTESAPKNNKQERPTDGATETASVPDKFCHAKNGIARCDSLEVSHRLIKPSKDI